MNLNRAFLDMMAQQDEEDRQREEDGEDVYDEPPNLCGQCGMFSAAEGLTACWRCAGPWPEDDEPI